MELDLLSVAYPFIHVILTWRDFLVFPCVFSAANLTLAGFLLTNTLGESMPSRHLNMFNLRLCNAAIIRYWPGLGSIPFFQFNSNSNSVIFNSNSNSNSTTHNKFQFQFQFQFRRFQFQFQFRRFQIPAISILEMTCWCLPWNWL